MRLKTFWTEDRVELLRAGWASGRTGNQLAKQLKCTRNMVMGKVYRLGMSIDRSNKIEIGRRISVGCLAHWRKPETRERRSKYWTPEQRAAHGKIIRESLARRRAEQLRVAA